MNTHYSVVRLRDDDTVQSVVAIFPTYPDALGYLFDRLPDNPSLDMIDDQGYAVGWEFDPPRLSRVAT